MTISTANNQLQIHEVIDRRGKTIEKDGTDETTFDNAESTDDTTTEGKAADTTTRFVFRLVTENPVTLKAKNFATINRYVAVASRDFEAINEKDPAVKTGGNAGGNKYETQSRIAVYDVHTQKHLGSVYRDAQEGSQMGHRILNLGYATD